MLNSQKCNIYVISAYYSISCISYSFHHVTNIFTIKTILLRHWVNSRRKVFFFLIIIFRTRDFILLYYATFIIQLAVSAYKNEISITIDAMKTTLIAKNMAEVCAKRSLRRSWKAVQRGLLNCFLRHPPAPEVVPTSI